MYRSKSLILILIVLSSLLMIVTAHGEDEETTNSENHIKILQPSNRAIVPTTFSIVFTELENEATGLYLLIDTDLISEGESIPEDIAHKLSIGNRCQVKQSSQFTRRRFSFDNPQ